MTHLLILDRCRILTMTGTVHRSSVFSDCCCLIGSAFLLLSAYYSLVDVIVVGDGSTADRRHPDGLSGCVHC